MPLVVGTDSYVTLEEADAYHAAMGNPSWKETPVPDPDNIAAGKEAALRRATAFIDAIARGKWRGVRADPEQRLAWPRFGVKDEDGYEIASDEIPALLKDAVCEIALKSFTGTKLMPDNTKANVASEAVTGAVSRSYFQGKSSLPVYNFAYKLLSGLVKEDLSGGSCVLKVRSGLRY